MLLSVCVVFVTAVAFGGLMGLLMEILPGAEKCPRSEGKP